MEWKFDYLKKEGIVSAKLKGVMDWEQHSKFAKEVFPFAKKHGSHKVLIDFLEVTPAFTILQIDDLPGFLSKLGVGPDLKIAAVHDPNSPKSSEFKFFKDVAALMSLNVRHFANSKEALDWLKSEH
jgi:hypothetical protein